MDTELYGIEWVTRKISRGVHVRARPLKRGNRAAGEVLLSKKRAAELTALKTSQFYQDMTFIDSRDDRIVFRKYLASMADAEAFFSAATSAANAVGVGEAVVLETVRANTKTVSHEA